MHLKATLLRAAERNSHKPLDAWYLGVVSPGNSWIEHNFFMNRPKYQIIVIIIIKIHHDYLSFIAFVQIW